MEALEKEYVVLFGERFLKCRSCKYFSGGSTCNLLGCSVDPVWDGCKEETIEEREREVLNL